jgi:hypothetical protein
MKRKEEEYDSKIEQISSRFSQELIEKKRAMDEE